MAGFDPLPLSLAQKIKRVVIGASIVGLSLLGSLASAQTTYQYDDLGRVIGVKSPNGSQTVYTYDAANNRTLYFAAQPHTLPDRLLSGQALFTNDTIWSTNGLYMLVLQGAGNLVLYGPNGALWSTPTANTAVNMAVMQGDGNFVLYGPSNQLFWQTGSGGNNGTVLVMQTDGNLVAYNTSNAPVWNSGTGNVSPTANNDTKSAYYQTALTFDPRTNDTDPNGDPLVVSGVGSASHGTTSFASGSITYTPASGYSGSDSFTYSISDGRTGTSTATVNMTVMSSNIPPTCSNWTITLSVPPPPNGTNTVTVSPTASNFTDHCSDSDGGTLSLVTPTMPFNATINRGQTLYYTYTVSDGQGGTGSATLTITFP